MPKYLVTYTFEVEVNAANEEAALDLAIEDWGDAPNGDWEAREVNA